MMNKNIKKAELEPDPVKSPSCSNPIEDVIAMNRGLDKDESTLSEFEFFIP
jgi:hypothetical protein